MKKNNKGLSKKNLIDLVGLCQGAVRDGEYLIEGVDTSLGTNEITIKFVAGQKRKINEYHALIEKLEYELSILRK